MERPDTRKVKVRGSISYNGVGTLIKYQGTVKKTTLYWVPSRNSKGGFLFAEGSKSRQGKFILQ